MGCPLTGFSRRRTGRPTLSTTRTLAGLVWVVVFGRARIVAFMIVEILDTVRRKLEVTPGTRPLSSLRLMRYSSCPPAERDHLRPSMLSVAHVPGRKRNSRHTVPPVQLPGLPRAPQFRQIGWKPHTASGAFTIAIRASATPSRPQPCRRFVLNLPHSAKRIYSRVGSNTHIPRENAHRRASSKKLRNHRRRRTTPVDAWRSAERILPGLHVFGINCGGVARPMTHWRRDNNQQEPVCSVGYRASRNGFHNG